MQKDVSSKVEADRQLLADAQARGTGATLAAYVKLSGPGWLQSAITLGGGSLAGALFLGALGGVNLLWLQLIAIIMGVVMLSAISYVTLSTGQRPFDAINQHINPVLGWGWLIATCMANMIWCMPQFSLCFAALRENLVGDQVQDDIGSKLIVSATILVAAGTAVLLQSRRGFAAKLFDWFLKALVGTIVICFFGVVVYLGLQGRLNWSAILGGFLPDFGLWTRPSGEVATLIASLPAEAKEYWTERAVTAQRAVMIGAAATAVGINMTFLMPYSMLTRGWGKTFRGLARFDLSTGMAIPYVLVTSCVVIAAAASFHGTADDAFLSSDPAVMATSPLLDRATVASTPDGPQAADSSGQTMIQQDLKKKDLNALIEGRVKLELGEEALAGLDPGPRTTKVIAEFAKLPEVEKRIAASLVQRDAFELSQALSPLLGRQIANTVFGIGIFGMGFSTIIILMLINGFAFTEAVGAKEGGAMHIVGCVVAGLAGASWPFFWAGQSKVWLAILASSFGMMLLPIAYITFFMMMNSRSLMGAEKPSGGRMAIWNVLMGVSVLGAIVAASSAIWEKIRGPNALAGTVVAAIAAIYILLVIVGFFLRPKTLAEAETPQ